MSEENGIARTCLDDKVSHRRELEKKIANAKHLSKPGAKNSIVVRSASGRWLFEIYTVGHTVEQPKRQ